MELTNEFMFSYLDTKTNEIKTVVYDDVANIDNTTLQSIPQTLNLIATGFRQHNWNPNDSTDSYGYNKGYRLNGSANPMVYNKSSKTYAAEDAVTYINYVGTYPSYYLKSAFVNSPIILSYNDKIRSFTINTGNSYRVETDDVSKSSNTLYTGASSESDNQVTKTILFDTKISIQSFADSQPDFGDVNLTDTPSANMLEINFPNNNIDVTLTTPKLIITQEKNQATPVIIGDTNVNVGGHMTPEWDNTLNRFAMNWHNGAYKSLTGNDGIDDDFTISGELITSLYDSVTGGKLYEETIDYSYAYVSNPIDPLWLNNDKTLSLSGYSSEFRTYITPDQDNIVRAEVVYEDASNIVQSIPIISTGTSLNFWSYHKYLRGKSLEIKAYYETLAGNFVKTSEVLCPVIKNYYDIKDLTLTLSGIKYDRGLSTEVGYEVPYLKEVDDVVLYNKFKNQFQTITDAHTRVDFTLTANEIDMQDIERNYTPAPETLWLIAIPATQKDNAIVKARYFDIQTGYMLERDSITKTNTFPKFDTDAAVRMIDWLDVETPNSPTTGLIEGVMFNTQTLSPIYEFPSDGEFIENTYTINVDLLQDSWAFFLIIKDSTDQYTGYCVSNPIKFEVPSSDSFDY